MIQRRLRKMFDERGITLVELSISMMLTALMSTLLISWIFSIASADDLHLANDDVIQELRDAKDEITRELRRARRVQISEDKVVQVWVDTNRDEVLGPGETVTWTLEPGGDLVRSTDGGITEIKAHGLTYGLSSFGYDAGAAVDVRNVSLTFGATVDAPRGADGVRVISTEVNLRSA